MSAEEALRVLAGDAADHLGPVLRRAYELGYRDALAQVPSLPVAPPAPAPVAPPAPAPEPASELYAVPHDPLAAAPWSGERQGSDASLVEVGAPEPTDDPPDDPPVVARVAPVALDWGESETDISEHAHDGKSLRIFPHATVGTLLRRIHDYFGLERFDIDVVIFRKGDRERRQLKKSVKLGKYAVGG